MNPRLPILAGAAAFALLLALAQNRGDAVHAEPGPDSSEPLVVTVYSDYV